MPFSFVGDIVRWAGGLLSPASNTAGDGSRVMPDVRVAGRKYTQVITNTPIGANAVYVSPWYDTNATGAQFVHVTFISDQATSSALLIQGTDTIGLPSPSSFNTVRTIGTNNGANPALTLVTVSALLPFRFWRFTFTNAATPQTYLSITATEYSGPPPGTWGSISGGGAGSVPSLIATSAFASGASAGLTITLLTTAGAPNNLTIDPIVGSANAANGFLSGICATSDGTRTGWQGVRMPSVFKTATAVNAGNTAAWTPAAGKKFRLMRYQIELTENATLAVAALVTVKFQDNVTDFGFQHDQFIPAAAGAVAGEAWRSGWIDIGNGYLSTVANNVLNFNISGGANLTAGQFRINVCGTEE